MARSIIVLLILALASSAALADGKVFPRFIAALPAIPDQQAIIAWDAPSSTETLAIDTQFVPAPGGAAPLAGDSPYAWVVPLPGPAAPEISAATPGLFPTVRSIFLPRVFDNGPEAIGPIITITVLLLLGVWISMRGQGSSVVSVVFVIAVFIYIAAMLLPSLGMARSSARGLAPGVALLSCSTIGSYDVAVVGADAAATGQSPDKALGDWFAANGFKLPASALPLLADYAARSWVFAAIKLRPEDAVAGAGFLSPHPLIFKFKTAAPVYPMRLTGLENGPLSLDLYVFGAARASTPGLKEIRCDYCEFGESVELSGSSRHTSRIAIGHPVLKGIVGALPAATKLSGTLTPAMQNADMPISFSTFERSGAVKHSPRAARWRGLEIGAAVVPAGIIVLVVIGAMRKADCRFVFRKLPWLVPVASTVGLVVWLTTSTVAVDESSRSPAHLRGRDYDAQDLPEFVVAEFKTWDHAPSIDEVRSAVRAIVGKHGMELKEGDSPHNWLVRPGESEGRIDLITHNWCGAPDVRRVW